MKQPTFVLHSPLVDLERASALFVGHPRHRAYLRLPLLGERGNKTLCVIGQNPSAANERVADKTIRYIEDLILQNFPDYRELVILNLYSQVDTKKELCTSPLNELCAAHFERTVREETDFLAVFGKLTNQRQYRFLDRASTIANMFEGKRVFKLDVGTRYAPHPGNSKILYRNFAVSLAPIQFIETLLQ